MEHGAQSTTNPKVELLDELQNREYRDAFVEAHAKDTVAFQIRQLRKANEWEQKDLAEKLGNPKLQPMISRYENPDYGRYSITTLLELARVFDVALIVRFAPHSELVEWDWTKTSTTLKPPNYSKDKKLATLRKACSEGSSTGKLASFPFKADLPSQKSEKPLRIKTPSENIVSDSPNAAKGKLA